MADNLHALTVLEAEACEPIRTGYKVNRTAAFSHLKRCLPRWLLKALPPLEQGLKVLVELAKNLIKVETNVSKPHRKHAYKSTC